MSNLLQNYREYTVTLKECLIVFFFNSGLCLDHQPKNTQFSHSHYHNELFTVLRGKMEIVTDHGVVELNPGETALIPAKINHKTLCSKDIFRVNIACLTPTDGINPFSKKFAELSASCEVLIYKNPILAEIVKHLLEYENGEYENKDLLIESCLSELAILMCQRELKDAEVTKRISDSKNYRDYAIGEIFRSAFSPHNAIIKAPTVSEVSRQIHLSEKQTERVVKNFFGRSFSEQVFFMKMDRAAELLEKTDLSVNKISAAVGYSATRGFFTAFKKRFNMTPAEYRKNKTDCDE